MWWTAPISRRGAARVGRPLLVREDRDQAPVARVEVEVALRLVVEVRLLEDERHPEHALPEADRRLPVGPDERDVVDALGLELPHRLSARRVLRLVLAALQAPPTATSSTARLDDAARSRSRVSRIASRRARRPRPRASRASSTATGSGGSCFTPGCSGLTRDRGRSPPARTRRRPRGRRREDVHAADDQHVVGAPDAADPRAGAAAGARARPHDHVVARAEAQERRGAVPEVREHELARGAVRQSARPRPCPGRSARRGRSRARRGASRPAPRTRPRARRRCRRSPSPR